MLLPLYWQAALYAQHYHYEQYKVINGLPSNETYMVHEDKLGYIWIATDHGLARFNGYEFDIFTTKDGVPDNTVFNFHEAPDSSLWFLTFNQKIGRYKNREFTTFYEVPTKEEIEYSWFVDYVFSGDTIIKKHNHHKVYYILRGDTAYPVRIKINSELEKCKAAIRFNKTPHILLKANLLNLGGETQYHFRYDNSLRLNDSLTLISRDDDAHSNSNKWLVLIRSDNEQVVKEFELPDKVSYMQRINGEILFSVPFKGIYEYLPETKEVKLRVSLPFHISGFTIDRNNILWVSTLENGVIKVINRRISIVPEFTGKPVLSCFVAKNTHIISKKHVYKKWDNSWTPIIRNIRSDRSCLRDSIAHVESHSGYIYKITPKGITELVRKPMASTNTVTYNNIFKLGKDNYIMNSSSSIMYIDSAEHNRVLTKAGLFPHKLYEIGVGTIRKMVREDEHHILLGGLNGLARLDIRDTSITLLKNENPLFGNRVNEIQFMQDSTLLISSRGTGVIVHHRDTTYAIGEENGMLSDLVTNISIDGDSVLWVSSNLGVNRVKLHNIRSAQYTIDAFTMADGLSSQKVNFVKLIDDHVYVCTENGLNILWKNIEKNHQNIPIYIHSVEINKEEAGVLPHYDLNHQQNTIDIRFTGISTRYLSDIVYKYRLRKDQDVWNETRNRSIELLSLPPDEYHVEIYATSPDGTISSDPATLHFTIHPPFWLTWWFITLCVVLAGFTVWLFMSFRIRRVRKEAEMQSAIHQLENKALSSQLNPHFIFNALTAIQHYMLKKDKYEAYHYLTHFATLIRSILRNSEDGQVTLQEEIELLNQYLELEQVRFPDKFTYNIRLEDKKKLQGLYVPSMLLQPYVENAIRHGLSHKEGDGHLSISFRLHNSVLLCEIEDDGIGREASKKIYEKRNHRSFAMNINRRRIELLNELYGDDISINVTDLYEGDQPRGTRVTISIPLNYEY